MLPPGPRLPRWLQTAIWATRPLALLKRAQSRYGDVFTTRPYGFAPIVVVADPDVIKEVFTSDPEVFAAGLGNAALAPVLGQESLLTLDGERHLRQRKMMLPPFHGEAIERYRERVIAITERSISRWPRGRTFAVGPRMQEITFEVILRAVFGVSDDTRFDRLRELLPRLLAFRPLEMWAVLLFPRVLDTPLGTRHPSMKIRPEVERLLLDEIEAHRASPEAFDDILSLLVAARDADGEPLSDRNLLDQLITLLLAGHETTTTGLTWVFERLAREPRVLDRLTETLDSGDETYLDAVVKETLRLRPVVDSVARVLTQQAELAGRTLPAGTVVLPSIALTHMARTSFPEPEAFRPERFIDASPAPYSYIPFGGGTRRCIGAAFATMEMRTVLSTVLAQVEIVPSTERPERQAVHHVTLVPSRGGRITVRPRLHADQTSTLANTCQASADFASRLSTM